MIKVGINGFGRIGRAIFRMNLENPRFHIAAVNDIDPDVNNHAYLLKYDTTYGRLKRNKIEVNDGELLVDGLRHPFYSNEKISDVPWGDHEVDVVIDSSGVYANVINSHKLVKDGGAKKVVVTHSPSKGVDTTIMVGVNGLAYDHTKHHVISSSICDANAVAPFVKAIDDAFGVECGEITTLHPWLQYQNLLDGTVQSVSSPGHYWTDYALGRNSVNSLIPKDTSLVKALSYVMPELSGRLHAMSFRTPTSIVSSADGVLLLQNKTNLDDVQEALCAYCKAHPDVLQLDDRSLVSVDYAGVEHAAVVDKRWMHLNAGRMLKFVLWYDNEWGYASRALKVVEAVS